MGLLLVLLMTLSMAGCNIGETVAEKAAEKILEGAGVDADISGEKVVVKGEDGQELTIGAGEWPTSEIAQNIPEFKGGNIVSVMEASDSIFIMIEDVLDKDFTDYLEEVKESFTKDSYEINTDTGLIYAATNDSEISMMLTYEKDAGFSITVTRAEP